MLANSFKELLSKYTNDGLLVASLWSEIATNYTHKDRFYHNLTHLQKIQKELLLIKSIIDDWDCLMFSLFYHDVIYQSSQIDNEEQSAILMKERLSKTSFEEISKCYDQILATKSHILTNQMDTDMFTDADLSILGVNWPDYLEYSRQIRLEYAIYPENQYITGRINVLKRFIAMPSIFKTPHFLEKFETKARQNINHEIKLLNKRALELKS